jgi:hypothetical protein
MAGRDRTLTMDNGHIGRATPRGFSEVEDGSAPAAGDEHAPKC